MLILGLLSTAVYLMLHIRYAFALGVLTGLLNIIPVVGAAICVALALLVAAIDSWGTCWAWPFSTWSICRLRTRFSRRASCATAWACRGLLSWWRCCWARRWEAIPGALVSVPTAVLVAVLVDEYLVRRTAPSKLYKNRSIRKEREWIGVFVGLEVGRVSLTAHSNRPIHNCLHHAAIGEKAHEIGGKGLHSGLRRVPAR
jgi:hypothetical protein